MQRTVQSRAHACTHCARDRPTIGQLVASGHVHASRTANIHAYMHIYIILLGVDMGKTIYVYDINCVWVRFYHFAMAGRCLSRNNGSNIGAIYMFD